MPLYTTGGGGGATIPVTDDTSTNATRYLNYTSVTTGNLATIYTSSTKLTFNPTNGNFTAGGTVTANSDEKLKKNIITITDAVEKVNCLRGVEYDRVDYESHQIGLIAQEVEKVLPDVVFTSDIDGTKSVAYSNIVALLIEAIKEQNKKIKVLEEKLGV